MTVQGDLARLYRDTVLDHSRHPRNFRILPGADRQATGHNALCGDKITLYLELKNGERIGDATFEATGCAISLASASMLIELVRGQPVREVRKLIGDVSAMFAGPSGDRPPGDMAALAGVREYPSRIRCATLPWRTLEAALLANPAPVSTEDEA